MRRYLLVLFCGLLSACITPTTQQPELDEALVKREQKLQQTIALDALVAEYRRVFDHGYPLLFAAESLCKEQQNRREIGWLLTNIDALPETMKTVGAEKYGWGDALSVVHIVANSPAAQAGIQPGDQLININSQAVPQGKDALEKFEKQYIKVAESLNEQNPTLNVTLKRGEQTLTLTVTPQPACAFRLLVFNSDSVNAFADGKNLAITRGMLRFADDLGLKTVLAHEIAHNIMHHSDARSRNGLLGFFVDLFALFHGINTRGGFQGAGTYAYSKAFESEADYVSLYVLALAQQPLENVPHFWRKMAAIHPGNIEQNHAATHPTTAQRFLALEQAVQEVRQKQRNQQPLIPTQ